VWQIEFPLSATAYSFQPGQRLRLQVSSGAHPRFARNLGMGEPFLTAERMVVAQQRVYHDAERQSALILPVV
jgi:predicted acyl esterase